MVFFLAKETCQIFLFIVICVAKVLFFQGHALPCKNNPCMHIAKKMLTNPNDLW